MTFPVSERVLYGVATLNQVVCQLRFPPILSIGADVPAAFQEQVRSRYPLYAREEALQAPAELASLLAQLPIRPPQAVTHTFASADQAHSISLGTEFIAVTTARYEKWEAMRDEIAFAQQALEKIYQPSFYTRVGLRYEDVIDREAIGIDQPWTDLFNSTLTGLLGAPESDVSDAVLEIMCTSLIDLSGAENARVRLRNGLAKTTDEKSVYLIDADYFSDRQRDGGEILDLLDYFRNEAGNLFRWAISDALAAALGTRDADAGA